jgi:hypothetical protein
MVAELQPPILPSRLYRYRSLTRSTAALAEEIAAIRDRYLYCAEFTSMNDPMEGLFQSSYLLRKHANYRTIVERIRDGKLGIGMACSSETYENMLMWAHYAENFSGICLGYSSNDLQEALPDSASLLRIAYLDKPPTVNITHVGRLPEITRRILSQKQYSWSYEREWRVLTSHTGRINFSDGQPICAIYLGPQMISAQRRLILDAARDEEIDVFEMTLSGYVPEWKKVEVNSGRSRSLPAIPRLPSRPRRRT